MFNRKKICSFCKWKRVYDSSRDIHNINEYIFCPICGEKLDTKGYSPNL